jgi:hypothetical protein
VTGSQAPYRAATDARRAWVSGGVLLIAATVFGPIFQPVASQIPGGAIIATALFSASMLVFAFGIRGSGSVTARRPLGTTALAALAIWVLLIWGLQSALLSSNFVLSDSTMNSLLAFGYVDSIVRFVAALVAVIQIARARVVPHPWNWAPTWALAAVTTPWVFEQIIAAGPAQSAGSLALTFGPTGSLIYIGGPVFLGVLAIVLANLSRRTRTVPIFRSRD